MINITANELALFVSSFSRYFSTVTKLEPNVTLAFLDTGDLNGFDGNGVVSFSGQVNGHVLVSMPGVLLKEMLTMQGERDLSEGNLLDAVGEIANSLAGNARKYVGIGLNVSVPLRIKGVTGSMTRVRQRPYVGTLRWGNHSAMVCVDLERTA
jgi:chemotaxis protein CheX